MNEYKYIYQNSAWPRFTWDQERVWALLAEVNLAKGVLLGKIDNLGLNQQKKANFEIISQSIIKSSVIEGLVLDSDEVRSTVARRLGIQFAGGKGVGRGVEGVVRMTVEAIEGAGRKLTWEQLCKWQRGMFPDGISGLQHFQAPAAEKLTGEIEQFLTWFNNNDDDWDLTLKAGVAQLWFLTLHPFEDDSGRIARVLSDRLLAREDGQGQLFYNLAGYIQKNKRSYYGILEKTQKGDLDITEWLLWFLGALAGAVEASEGTLALIFRRHSLWQKIEAAGLNQRQHKVLMLLTEDFVGKLTSSKWAKLTKTSQDTAHRDIEELLELGILQRVGKGPATHYVLG